MSFSLVPGFAQRYPKDEGDLLSGLDGPVIESCCTTLAEARSAEARGADRIELCTELSVGGLTPSRDLIRDVINALTIPVNVLIRPSTRDALWQCLPNRLASLDPSHAAHGPLPLTVPRVACVWEALPPAHDSRVEETAKPYHTFVYGEDAINYMIADIAYCKSVGAAGIVVGALTQEGHIDVVAMRRLVAAAQPLPVTFHRAYDVCTEDPFEALERIIDLGCARLLTSGRAATAWEGRGLLSQLVRRAGDRLIVMPGRGVTPANLSDLSAFTHAPEYHGTQLP